MLRRDLLTSGMLLAAGGLAAASVVGAGAPVAEAAAAAAGKKVTGLQINHVAGKAGRTADALTGDFAGRVRITEISLLDEETRTLKVKGLLSGNVKKASGSFVRHVKDEAFTATATLVSGGSGAKAAAAAAACPILALDIGAIHLDLLGLVVDLAPVNLDIVAQSGPGKLLGNLLCAVVNLLNGVGTGSLAGLLGQINQILSGVLTIINGLGG